MHELTHDIETSGLYEQFSKRILGFIENAGINLETMRGKVKEDYSEAGIELSSAQTDAEIVAKFAEQYLFTNEKAIQRLCNTEPTIFERIRYWISDMAAKFKGAPEERFLWEAEWFYEKALATRGERTGAGVEQADIVGLADGRMYVKASRNIITGKTQADKKANITAFFNYLIDKKSSIDISTEEGEILTLTKKDTRKKAKDAYKDVGGKKLKLSAWEFDIKLNAESHIDELAQIAPLNNDPLTPDYKNHKFAKDGFSYRNVFFQDFDGQFYKITLSIGHNGQTATVYNVGEINKSTPPSAKVIAVMGSNARWDAFNNTLAHTGPGVNGQNSFGRSFDELAAESQSSTSQVNAKVPSTAPK